MDIKKLKLAIEQAQKVCNEMNKCANKFILQDSINEMNQALTIPVVVKSAFFTQKDLLKKTKTTFIEKLILYFINKRYKIDEVQNNILIYKKHRGKIYVIDHFITPPKMHNCRCDFALK